MTPSTETGGAPLRIPRSQHGVAAESFSANAVDAVMNLQRHGYESYIVGGAVRDLIFGLAPKDFDISTSAHPQKVKKIFRNARIIGRRFRLVHLYYYARGGGRRAREIIETSTFRAAPTDTDSESGRIISDNVYGTAADDARRRDFTLNALFYDPADGSVVDHTGGFAHLQNRRLAAIGAPVERMREDPVRMLRALRLAAKLDLQQEPALQDAIRRCASDLAASHRSRVFDEIVKAMNAAVSEKFFEAMKRHHLLERALPDCARLEGADAEFAKTGIRQTDERARAGRQVSLSFFLAILLWPQLAAQWREARQKHRAPVMAMQHAMEAANLNALGTIPRRIIAKTTDLFFLQARLTLTRPRAVKNVAAHPQLDRALAFLRLRAKNGEQEAGQLHEQWQAVLAKNKSPRTASLSDDSGD